MKIIQNVRSVSIAFLIGLEFIVFSLPIRTASGMQIVGEFSDEPDDSTLWLSIDRRGGPPFGGGTKCAVITVKNNREMEVAILDNDDWSKFVECWKKESAAFVDSDDTICDVDLVNTSIGLYHDKEGRVSFSLTDAHSSAMGPAFVMSKKKFESFNEKVRAVSKFFGQ